MFKINCAIWNGTNNDNWMEKKPTRWHLIKNYAAVCAKKLHNLQRVPINFNYLCVDSIHKMRFILIKREWIRSIIAIERENIESIERLPGIFPPTLNWTYYSGTASAFFSLFIPHIQRMNGKWICMVFSKLWIKIGEKYQPEIASHNQLWTHSAKSSIECRTIAWVCVVLTSFESMLGNY